MTATCNVTEIQTNTDGAVVSTIPVHAAILYTGEGFPLMNQCYKHTVQPEPEPEPEPDEE